MIRVGNKLRRILFAGILVLGLAASSLGITLTVDDDGPADFNKIQEAINFAQDGDTIEVQPGFYEEILNNLGKKIIITGSDPNNSVISESTIIDGMGNTVITFDNGEDSDSVLTGLKIQNGNYGIYCIDADPWITKCIISDSITGIYCFNANPTIETCIVENNLEYGIRGNNASPVIIHTIVKYNINHGITYCNGEIRNCLITQNGGNGVNSCAGEIHNCYVLQNDGNGFTSCDGYIHNNQVSYNGDYGLYQCHGSTITDCKITYNFNHGMRWCPGEIKRCRVSHNKGSGIFSCYGPISDCIVSGNIDAGIIFCSNVSNCTIVGNGSYGFYHDSGTSTLINNIIALNRIEGIHKTNDPTILQYNNVWSNFGGNYNGPTPGLGDIHEDPLFIEPGYWDDPYNTPSDMNDDIWIDGDYHLQYDSFCINAGMPDFVVDPNDLDMDGESRIRLGRVDIGADEAGSNPADFDENGRVDLADWGMLAAAWLSDSEASQWNPVCDISEPADEMITIHDLTVFSVEWLWQAEWYMP